MVSLGSGSAAIGTDPTVDPANNGGSPEPVRRERPLAWLEKGVEALLFASRWLLAPLYLGLIGAIIAIAVKFAQAFYELFRHIGSASNSDVTLRVLELLDITLLGNLILIIVFAGYESFVSKIDAAIGSEDRPHWMGHVDFSGLKMKIIGSIVALSVIGLLQDFINAGTTKPETIRWQLIIHVTFLGSGVFFAIMDYIAERSKPDDADEGA